MVRVARDRAMDRLRARRVPRSRGRARDQAWPQSRPWRPTPACNPGTTLYGCWRAASLTDALAGLPEDRRQLIEAAFFEGYTHSELAQRFGLPLGDREDAHPRRRDCHAEEAGARRMIQDDVQALALADAIGALDPDERGTWTPAWPPCAPHSVRAEVAHLFYDAAWR